MLVAKRSEQPRSVHEVQGSNPNVMKLFFSIFFWYIQSMYMAYHAYTLYVLKTNQTYFQKHVQTMYVLGMYLVCISIELIHKSCTDCFSTSDSRLCGCRTYTPHTHDIIKAKYYALV